MLLFICLALSTRRAHLSAGVCRLQNARPVAFMGVGGQPAAVEGLKQAVLSAISDVRRARTPDARARFFLALEALEAERSDVAAIDGRWSLVFSTDGSAGRAGSGPADPLQEAFGRAYKVFFRFAPALAGGQDVAFLGASNEQLVDLAAGTVDNTVTVRPPVGRPLVLCVRGLVAREGDSAGSFAVTFTESELRTPLGLLRVPLPRPRGQITSTFCDGELRVARGSKGTLFVLRRLGGREVA